MITLARLRDLYRHATAWNFSGDESFAGQSDIRADLTKEFDEVLAAHELEVRAALFEVVDAMIDNAAGQGPNERFDEHAFKSRYAEFKRQMGVLR